MALSHRQKLSIILLLLYLPGIFILAHIPLARAPSWLMQTGTSDKGLHYLGYLVLIFLLWLTISPNRKVNWRRAAVWWVLFVVVWYGVFDEWLQGYVGRDPDIMDFFADLAGTLTGLILLSIFPFWSALLAVTGGTIIILTNFMRANLAELLPVTTAAFHLFGYGFFSLLWIQYMYYHLPIRAPEAKWLAGAIVPPTGFLLAVELFSAIAGNDFRLLHVIISATGISAVAAAYWIMALRRSQKTK